MRPYHTPALLVLACSLLLPCALLAQSNPRPAPKTPTPSNKPTTKPAPTQASTKPKASPQKVKFGLYITHLYDIDFVRNQYKVQFWSWFHHHNKKYKPNKTTELMNARKFTRHIPNEEFVKGTHWDTAFIRANIKQQWDVRRFPFDTQRLVIHLEDVNLTAEQLVLVPDKQGSKMDPHALPRGWKLAGFAVSTSAHPYQTSFGDPSARPGAGQRFSRFTATITLQRKGWRLFFTIFTGFFVAGALALIAFIINSFPKLLNLLSRGTTISLCTGALFAAVGGIYVMSSKLPYTTDFTFADAVQITTFCGIALAITGSVSAEVLLKLEQESRAARVNQVLLGVYLLLILGTLSTLLIR